MPIAAGTRALKAAIASSESKGASGAGTRSSQNAASSILQVTRDGRSGRAMPVISIVLLHRGAARKPTNHDRYAQDQGHAHRGAANAQHKLAAVAGLDQGQQQAADRQPHPETQEALQRL